jgi:hypothetical protein
VALSQAGESPGTRQEDGVGPSSSWFGDRQRACPRIEVGETDAAEPGQAETGPADQATMEHARIEPRSTRAGEWRRNGKHTHSHRERADRHGRSMTLIYRTDRTRVPVTQCGVSRNEGEGWGTTLRSSRRLYISAPRRALREKDRTDEAPQSNETNATPAVLYAARISLAPRASPGV